MSTKTGRGVSLPPWSPAGDPRLPCWVLVILPVDVLHPNAGVHESYNGCGKMALDVWRSGHYMQRPAERLLRCSPNALARGRAGPAASGCFGVGGDKSNALCRLVAPAADARGVCYHECYGPTWPSFHLGWVLLRAVSPTLWGYKPLYPYG